MFICTLAAFEWEIQKIYSSQQKLDTTLEIRK